MAHIAITGMPFGGQGRSGFGRHRGKAGFMTFSHPMSTCVVPTTPEVEVMLDFRYKTGDTDAKYNIYKAHMELPLP